MVDPRLREELLQPVSRLSPQKQQRVLQFAAAWSGSGVPGAPGSGLLALAGVMSREEADEMLRAIAEDCGRIDPNGW
jgi:hypothetical protein